MSALKKIEQQSPFPWNYVSLPSGQVLVLDAANREVPMFSVLEMAKAFTERVSQGTASL